MSEMIFADAINYAHEKVVECGKIDLHNKMEAHNAIDRIEAAHKAEIAAKDAIIVKFTKELHDTERFLDWLKASEKIGTWCKQQVEHRAKGVRAALAAEGGAK